MNRTSSGTTRGSSSDRAREALADITVGAWRPAAEAALLMADPVFWGWGVPHGDGHAVLVLPGLFGGDGYLRLLRDWLRRNGYAALKSGLERNPGWSESLLNELGAIAEDAFRDTGQQVTIIGHSMGGVQGRAIAARRPHAVRHVITLGSPLRLSRWAIPRGVRLSAIASPDDRIVRPPGATAQDGRTKNYEVRGSHIGLAFNPAVYRYLARLLPDRDPRPDWI